MTEQDRLETALILDSLRDGVIRDNFEKARTMTKAEYAELSHVLEMMDRAIHHLDPGF